MKNIATRLALSLSILCLWTSAQAQPGGGACPPRPKGRFFGYFVDVAAGTVVGNTSDKKEKAELTCWVSGKSATGQYRTESKDQYADLTAEYSYTVGPTGISGSTRIYGQVNNIKRGSASGNAHFWLMWHDMLTFHSNKLPHNGEYEFRTDPGKAEEVLAKSLINVKVKLLQNPPQCSGMRDKFVYETGVVAAAMSGSQSDGGFGPGQIRTGTPDHPNTAYNWFIRPGKCGIGNDYHYATVRNDQDMSFQITVNAGANGSIGYDDSPEGHLKVEFSAIRLCIVRPEKPSDLTITAASGADYWCP
jgi:hypothetical protein